MRIVDVLYYPTTREWIACQQSYDDIKERIFHGNAELVLWL
jgi:hypothetical protein